MNIISGKFGRYLINAFIMFVLLFTGSVGIKADKIDDIKAEVKGAFSTSTDYSSQYSSIQSSYDSLKTKSASSTDEKYIIAAQMDMYSRQMDAIDSYSNISNRVNALDKNDTRRSDADNSLKLAATPLDTFLALNPEKKDSSGNYELISSVYKSAAAFNDAEKKAVKAISEVNQYLLAPARPGSVPKGDLMNDFIPGIIRILFRFASLAVLVSFVVSGVMFVIVFDSEDRVTKAKHMLYYSLIGFAFVTLAFAIVKAVTDIDFFGFI